MFIIINNIKFFLIQYKKILYTVFITGLLCCAIAYAAASILYRDSGLEKFTLAVVDNDDTFETRLLFSSISETKEITQLLDFVKITESEAANMLKGKEIEAYVVIPENFTNDIIRGINSPARMYANDGIKGYVSKLFINAGVDLLAATQSTVYAVLDEIKESDDKELYNKAFADINIFMINLALARGELVTTTTITATGVLPTIVYYVTLGFILLACVTSLIISHYDYYTVQFLDRLKIANVGFLRLITADIVSSFIINLILNSFVVAAFVIINKTLEFAKIHFNIYSVSSFILFNLCLATTTVFVNICFKNFSKYIVVYIISLAAFFISGGILPPAFLPEFVNKLSKFSLNYYAFDGFKSFFTDYNGLTGIVGMAVFAFVFYICCYIALFRRRIR